MSIVSHAQNFEDVLLWRALHDVENGRYLDIGAQDPVIDSVSLAFYEMGWRGVHVEPTPAYAEKLREARPDEVVIQAAVTDADQPFEFYEFPGTGLSTGKLAIAERHATAGFAQRKIIVPPIRLQHLIDTDGADFHWVKIDVEGMEPDTLRSWGESKRRPWVFVVEATYPLSQEATHDSWIKELVGRDYREVYFDGLSRYFLHDAQARRSVAFEASVNVFDEFAITRHHFSAVCLNKELRSVEQDAEMQRTFVSEIQSELAAAQQQLIGHQETASRSQALAEQAERERDAARAEQIATYNVWVEAERQHGRHVETLLIQREEVKDSHRRELEGLRLKWEASLAALHEEEKQLNKTQADNERLEYTILQLTDRLAQAEELIAEALAVPPDRWQRLGRALGFVRDDPAKVMLLSGKAASSKSNVQSVEPAMSIERFPEAKLYLHASSLSELLSLDGTEFVRSAYATMLGREADPEGEAYYASRLKDGIPRLQILLQMRKSPEAKLLLDPLPGLDDAFRRFRVSSWFRGKKRAAEEIEAAISAEANKAHVQHFMQYYDEEYVRVVYLYYLGREPDEPGLKYYTHQLRRGVSRQQILIDVARSQEAKLRGRSALGQNSLETAISLDKIPIIGSLISILRFNIGIRNHLQDMRALQNYVYRFSKKVG